MSSIDFKDGINLLKRRRISLGKPYIYRDVSYAPVPGEARPMTPPSKPRGQRPGSIHQSDFEIRGKGGARVTGYLQRMPALRQVEVPILASTVGGKRFGLEEHKAVAHKALSPRVLREALQELKQRFPEARVVKGLRDTGIHAPRDPYSGARTEQKMKLRERRKRPMSSKQLVTRRKIGLAIRQAARQAGKLGKIGKAVKLPVVGDIFQAYDYYELERNARRERIKSYSGYAGEI